MMKQMLCSFCAGINSYGSGTVRPSQPMPLSSDWRQRWSPLTARLLPPEHFTCNFPYFTNEQTERQTNFLNVTYLIIFELDADSSLYGAKTRTLKQTNFRLIPKQCLKNFSLHERVNSSSVVGESSLCPRLCARVRAQC